MNDFAAAWISKCKPQLVILSAYWPPDAAAALALKQTITAMEGIKIIVLGQGPFYKDTVPHLLALRRASGDQTNDSRNDLDAGIFKVDRSMRNTLGAAANYVSVLDRFCNSGHCLMASGDIPFHWDAGHLTRSGSNEVISSLMADIDRIIGSPGSGRGR